MRLQLQLIAKGAIINSETQIFEITTLINNIVKNQLIITDYETKRRDFSHICGAVLGSVVLLNANIIMLTCSVTIQ